MLALLFGCLLFLVDLRCLVFFFILVCLECCDVLLFVLVVVL